MSDFLQLVESLDASQASREALFGGEGKKYGANSPERMQALQRFLETVNDARNGSRQAAFALREAQTTSDFDNLFGDALSIQLLGAYREYPSSWRSFVRVNNSVPDFRTVKLLTIDGGDNALSKVPEDTEYPEAALTDGIYSYTVAKYGRIIPFSWEAWLNDNLGAFSDTPARLARAARRTEQRFVTGLYADANGPHASFYTAGNKNIINQSNGAATDNPPLSIVALQDAMTVLSKQVDSGSEPIFVETVVLVVPPALEVTAQNLLNGTQLEVVEAGGTANQRLIAANWMRNRVTLVVDPYLPVISATANGNRAWYLFAATTSDRPALEVGYLRGNAEPALFRKASNAVRVGGGGDDFAGDFETDEIKFKVRHVIGGTRVDPKMTVASNGSGA